MDWVERLTKDKSLVQVYWKARTVATSRWNKHVGRIVFLVVLAGSGLGMISGDAAIVGSALVSGIRRIAEIGFVFTTAILGFLIAGFAIFASITKPEVFVELAQTDYRDSGISNLQFMFYNFLLVFIHFIVFLAVTVFIEVFLYPNGPLTDAVGFVLSLFPGWGSLALVLAFSVLAGWLAFLLMLLKSFIWNLYQAVLVSIGLAAGIGDDEAGGDRD